MKLRSNLHKLALGAALSLSALPVGVAAQDAAPAQPKAEDVQNAVLYLNVMVSALRSEQVEEPVKNALVGCLYNNALGKIGTSVDGLIAKNADKVHRDKPGELLQAIALVCGYQPEGASAGNER
ncbi:hypothetical protein [Novosphingobium decolorationis]|uniref:hypothetical protein n=1 Tax=Novosphingobium decolorationis TaxID=2698673 RepID=UPI001EF150D8|nr:hypothetical protein [Novosphingobium decolorationis]MED5546497.1 hypothetical protein [Pseudomonadota bacterium]